MHYLFIALLTLISFHSFSQTIPSNTTVEKPSSGYVAFNLGGSFPLEDFGNDNIRKIGSGFAKTGFNADILNIGYPLAGNFMGYLKLNYSSYKVDEDELEKINARLGSETRVSTEKPWSFRGMFVGLGYAIPISNDNFLDVIAMVGTSRLSSPEINTRDIHSNIIQVQEPDSDTDIAFSLGLQFRSYITEKVFLSAGLEYIQGKYELATDINVDGQLLGYAEWEQKYSAQNLKLGIGYRLQ